MTKQTGSARKPKFRYKVLTTHNDEDYHEWVLPEVQRLQRDTLFRRTKQAWRSHDFIIWRCNNPDCLGRIAVLAHDVQANLPMPDFKERGS